MFDVQRWFTFRITTFTVTEPITPFIVGKIPYLNENLIIVEDDYSVLYVISQIKLQSHLKFDKKRTSRYEENLGLTLLEFINSLPFFLLRLILFASGCYVRLMNLLVCNAVMQCFQRFCLYPL